MCADLVEVEWKDKTGRQRRYVANLEDISLSGACLQLDVPVPLHTFMEVHYPKGELCGKVRYCIFRDIGYFIGLAFTPGSKWSRRQYRPQHLLDPRRLVARALTRLRDQPQA